jgi:hypothetical protein
MRRAGLITLVAALVFAATSCQYGVTMWSSCDGAPKADQFGTDLQYVLHCVGGTWKPIMTVDEYVKIELHQPVVIAPLPTEPTTTVRPTVPAGGCYVDSNQTDEDLYFDGQISRDDAATYVSTNGSCTGGRSLGTVVYAQSLPDAFAACVALGARGVSPDRDLSTFGNVRLTNLWACLP